MTSKPARDVDRPEPNPPGRVMRVSVLTIAVAFLAAAVAPTTASSAPASFRGPSAANITP